MINTGQLLLNYKLRLPFYIHVFQYITTIHYKLILTVCQPYISNKQDWTLNSKIVFILMVLKYHEDLIN